MSGHAIEFTPSGLRELSQEQLAGNADVPVASAQQVVRQNKSGQAVEFKPFGEPAPEAPPQRPALPTARPASLKLDRRQWVKELRQRRALLKKEIKQLRELEHELDEVNRLITAATAKTPRNVRNIDSARRSG